MSYKPGDIVICRHIPFNIQYIDMILNNRKVYDFLFDLEIYKRPDKYYILYTDIFRELYGKK